MLSAPGKWQESPPAPCLGSPDRPQKVRLIARGTSAPRRARSDPRQAVLTTRCADRIRNPVPAGLGDRSRPRQRVSPTAVGREPAPGAAVKSVRPGAPGSGAPRQRHTAQYQAPEEVRIHYPYHPRAGLSLQVIGRTEYQGEGFVIVCLPDGTRIHVPEWMTQPESANPPLHWPQRLSLASLTALRIAVDCVLSLQPGVTTHHGGIDEGEGVANAGRSIQCDRMPECAAGSESCRGSSTAGEAAVPSAAGPVTSTRKRGGRP